MRGTLDSPPIVIRTSRVAHVIAFAVAIVAFAFDWRNQTLDILHLAIPVLIGLYASWQLLDPSQLVIAPDGVSWLGTFAKRHWSWNEISNFAIGPFGGVACDLSDTRSWAKSLRGLNKYQTGHHGVIGFAWEGGAASCVALLKAAQRRWQFSHHSLSHDR